MARLECIVYVLCIWMALLYHYKEAVDVEPVRLLAVHLLNLPSPAKRDHSVASARSCAVGRDPRAPRTKKNVLGKRGLRLHALLKRLDNQITLGLALSNFETRN